MPMGKVASSDHMIGSVKSAINPSETNVAQKTLRSMLLFYRLQSLSRHSERN